MTLSATKHLVEIRDSNFRDLFRAEHPVLVDCCAQWYVRSKSVVEQRNQKLHHCVCVC